jgi:dipeptidase E
MSLRILAFSSSRAGNSGYLETVVPLAERFLGEKALNVAFIPFASVDGDYEEYTGLVRQAFSGMPHKISTVLPENARSVLEKSDAIVTGGGNTFKLLHDIYRLGLIDIIRMKVNAGTPYIGWSAGANITGQTIGTTNDMPIIQPESFRAVGFFRFQINPHYFSVAIPGHNGETRDQRLEEFIKMNPAARVMCLPEGTALHLEEGVLRFTGQIPGVLLQEDESGKPLRREIKEGTDLSFLL